MAALPARELVLAFFHAASDRSLDVSTLVAATGFLGLTGNATRVALSRLGTEGWVVRDERGRYRLKAERAARAAGLASYRALPALAAAWKGRFFGCLFEPKRKGELPDELRRLGFRAATPGLAVRPENLRGGVELLEARLGAGRLLTLDGTGTGGWRALWDGAELERGYERILARLEKSTRKLTKLSDAAQLAETWAVAQTSIVELEQDPLLPEGWVDVALRSKVVTALATYDRDARTHWMKMVPGLELDGSPGLYAEAS